MRGWFGFAGLAAAVAIGGVLLGFGSARVDVERLETRAASLEESNRALRRTLESWPEGVRSARAPLEERIRDLERQLVTTRLEARPPVPAAPLPAVAQRPPVAKQPPAARPPAEPELPAVSTSPPGSGPADCNILIGPEFSLDPGEPGIARFGGKLRLALVEDADGRNLHVAGDELSPYPIEHFPAHVAWECDGLPYIVSLCGESAGTLEGQVSLAAAFEESCG